MSGSAGYFILMLLFLLVGWVVVMGLEDRRRIRNNRIASARWREGVARRRRRRHPESFKKKKTTAPCGRHYVV